MTKMTDAFKKLFLGLGGDPKELVENNDVGDYILDLEDAIKGYVKESVPIRPDYIVYYLDISNNSNVLDYASSNSITMSGPYTSKKYIVVESGEKRTVNRSEFLAYEKKGVKAFFILKCKLPDEYGSFVGNSIFEFIPSNVSTDIPKYDGSYYRQCVAYGNTISGVGVGRMTFDLISDTSETASVSYRRTV